VSEPARLAALTRLYEDGGMAASADALLAESLGPRPHSMLLDLVAGWGVDPGGVILDAGCRDGRFGLELAERSRCRVIGVDAVQASVRCGPAVPGQLSFVCGDLLSLPLRDGSVDLVWCRDVLEHIADPLRLLRECRRVVGPGGRMLLHTVFATDLLEPRERTRLFAALSLAEPAMDSEIVEDAIAAAGFEVSGIDRLGSEWQEYDLEHDASRILTDLRAVSRLLRRPEHFRSAFGEAWYERILAFEQWRPFLLLGKLDTRVYRLTARG
jgi:SAM-dependent methyltransferase